jgi:hypothetical protein
MGIKGKRFTTMEDMKSISAVELHKIPKETFQMQKQTLRRRSPQ